MATLIDLPMKQDDGSWKNYTIAINDETDQYGNNVSVFMRQTKDERTAKAKKKYVANGKVVWTDGIVKVAEKVDAPATNAKAPVPAIDNDELPF